MSDTVLMTREETVAFVNEQLKPLIELLTVRRMKIAVLQSRLVEVEKERDEAQDRARHAADACNATLRECEEAQAKLDEVARINGIGPRFRGSEETVSEKKLYAVMVVGEMLVLASDEREAAIIAERNIRNEDSSVFDFHASPLVRLDHLRDRGAVVGEHLGGCLPWGGDGQTTIRELLEEKVKT